ncbi:hypothetical protein BDW42DRAFT_163843 [Aspergillus taichungensis]|uniref:Uncharacterized protein n=1 Tax=Aspergillus taichungensis TaxID=482145 RepID=A0A2J5I262_9EURO|nr:hypothetical protein BDW42DRAFT_163843 [Aspergillus taichungensis]
MSIRSDQEQSLLLRGILSLLLWWYSDFINYPAFSSLVQPGTMQMERLHRLGFILTLHLAVHREYSFPG